VSEGLVMECEGCGRDECEYVTAQLGVDPDAEAPGWPPVLLFHTAGATTSRWIVFEIWESRDAHQVFTNERLAPVLVIVGFTVRRTASSGSTCRRSECFGVSDRTT
jgi:hypothetical protein